ncbi:MAG: hypothetical protein N2C14_03125 [Planctomycetales bacterium]
MGQDSTECAKKRRLQPLQFSLRTLCVWTVAFAVMFALTRSQLLVEVLVGTVGTFLVGSAFCVLGLFFSRVAEVNFPSRKPRTPS